MTAAWSPEWLEEYRAKRRREERTGLELVQQSGTGAGGQWSPANRDVGYGPTPLEQLVVPLTLTDVAVRPRGKYGNAKTGGYASKKEAQRAFILKLMQDAGEIRGLKERTRFLLIPAQYSEAPKPYRLVERACFYECDFEYDELSRGEWRHVVEDCKSEITKTPQYRIKKKLMLFVHKIRVRET